MKSHRIIAAAAALALAVTPAALAKKDGESKGKGKDKSALKGQNGKGHGKGKNVVLKGTVVSVDEAGAVTVTVAKATKHGRSLVGTDAVFTATKVNVADVNLDGAFTTADLQTGDKVVVQLRLKSDSTAPYAARHIVDQTNPKPEDSEEAEAETTVAPVADPVVVPAA